LVELGFCSVMWLCEVFYFPPSLPGAPPFFIGTKTPGRAFCSRRPTLLASPVLGSSPTTLSGGMTVRAVSLFRICSAQRLPRTDLFVQSEAVPVVMEVVPSSWLVSAVGAFCLFLPDGTPEIGAALLSHTTARIPCRSPPS